ncbi:MAG TPA: OmpA family protein [Bryobacteraceae bacterium]|jgi:outer membrane protein OmpA-like peptidoglycan-associated protein|nr:OmpA family protein [Bryobacteraceae bacterium]
MKIPIYGAGIRKAFLYGAAALAACSLTLAVTPNARTFTADEEAKVSGVIVSRDGQVIKLRTADDSIGTVDITNETKIQLKKGGLFHRTSAMDAAALVPGLTIDVDGKGNEKGELVASKVQFDPNSMRASRAIDTRVAPLESRTGTLEGRETTLEGRAGQLETRAGQLEDQQKQTAQQVTQVKGEADQANQGVSNVNNRVTNLDNYQTADSATVYFKVNSYALSPEAKQQLDALAQKAQSQKGYMIEVAGFADSTGKAAKNQVLSERRADAVTQYLEQQGNIPIHRIIRPTGMGTSHEAASNDTADGRKMNRRVEVKVLVNEGLVGGSGAQAQATTPTAPADTNH